MDSLEGRVGAYLATTKVTKQELALTVGVKSVVTLNRKVSGESELSFYEAVRLAKVLGMGLDEMLELIPACSN